MIINLLRGLLKSLFNHKEHKEGCTVSTSQPKDAKASKPNSHSHVCGNQNGTSSNTGGVEFQ